MGRCHRISSGPLSLCHRPLQASEQGLALQPARLGKGGFVAADCRLDEPGEIAAALGVDRHRRDDAALIAQACQSWGADAARRLNGSFAFAYWDAAAGRLILARDGLGTRPLYYVAHPRYLLFASSLQSLLAEPSTPTEIDDLVLADCLTRGPQDNQATLYRAIRRVPPGGMVVVEGERVRASLYWTLDDIAPIRFRHDTDYVMAARYLLDRAVECRLPADGRLGVQLSGGLDSAGVAATAARLLGNRSFAAFHRAPGAPHPYDALDERALVGEVASRYPNMALTILDGDSQDYGDTEPEIDAAKYLVPRGRGPNATWFAPMSDAAAAADISVMLTGGCGNFTLSWEGRPHFGADLRAGRWGPAWRGAAMEATRRHQSVPRFLAGHLLKPIIPMALHRGRAPDGGEGRSRWSRYSMVSDEFLASLDYASHARDTGHDRPFQRGVTRADRFRTLQSQRNRDKQSGARRRGGPETIDPYADRRLVEFTLAIPENQFWHRGEDRWLARRVLADRLPHRLVTERRRGLQCPEWFELASRRREGMAEAIERIARSPLASRVVDVPRMRALLDDWPKDAVEAHSKKQIYGRALARGISIGGFLRWHERGNE